MIGSAGNGVTGVSQGEAVPADPAASSRAWLEPVDLADAMGLRNQELRRARLLVIEHRDTFMEKWREYFST
jgi:hypothetical protein